MAGPIADTYSRKVSDIINLDRIELTMTSIRSLDGVSSS